MAELRLREDAARNVLLLRAIESEDAGAAVFTPEDRQYATSSALHSASLDERGDPRQTAAFLAYRAKLALERLVGRYPLLQRARASGRWPVWLNLALPGAALISGLVSNRVDGDRLNILAFPLLGMLLWNLVAYGWLLFQALRAVSGRSPDKQMNPRWLSWVFSPASARLAGHPTLERGVERFGREWSIAAAPLTRARARRTFHLSAAMFAIGIIGGMFVRARYTAEYRAGWAGTWEGAEQEVSALLNIILAPASALTGITLPTAERLRELRGAAENAGDWLILWIVTAGLFVIIPRLVLAGWEAMRSMALSRRISLRQDFYVRTIVRNAIGRERLVLVVPYAMELTASLQAKLTDLLRHVLGEKTSIRADVPIPYGAEEEWIAREADSIINADQLILLFSLASTPESENHGAFVEGLVSRLGRDAELTVLLEDSSFMHKIRGQPSAQRRLDERLQAWKAVLVKSGLEPIRINLGQEEIGDSARSLEQALLRTGVLA